MSCGGGTHRSPSRLWSELTLVRCGQRQAGSPAADSRCGPTCCTAAAWTRLGWTTRRSRAFTFRCTPTILSIPRCSVLYIPVLLVPPMSHASPCFLHFPTSCLRALRGLPCSAAVASHCTIPPSLPDCLLASQGQPRIVLSPRLGCTSPRLGPRSILCACVQTPHSALLPGTLTLTSTPNQRLASTQGPLGVLTPTCVSVCLVTKE